ncbi:PREDICTED: mitochondrial import receptor subunit TOM40-1-like [Camelina sativa]|uniref:Mitochondrial import receptor subunit TOM40-1-like n=1 Tax=Camelina sativa TaxID=90675 RepID=A0ABM1R894_CAMSA|nr:PREDICTED: mitochondrial import receptor subunit TOM40-1-like [Camelina sativa]
MADLLPPPTTEQADEKLAFVGNVTTSGSLSAGVKAFITDKLIVKAKTELENARLSMALVKFEYLARNYRAQFSLADIGLYATYFQRVTPRLSLGGHVYNFGVSKGPKQWGVGYTARYETDDKMIASAFVDSSGLVCMDYVHKISKKVSLVTDFEYECFSRYVEASVGCDCNYGQSRVQGKIDSNGVVYAHLTKKINMGLEYQLSASLDHIKKDYKLGLCLNYG